MNDIGTFAQAVGSWHDFYMMVGTAAATLVGLLFVSLSLNIDAITAETSAGSRVLAAQTFANFLFVLLFAVIFLIPNQGPLGLGLPLVGMGTYGLYLTMRRALLARRDAKPHWGRGSLMSHVVTAALCYAALLAVAVSVLLGQTGWLYWLVPVMITLIVEASSNAWNMLLSLRRGQA